MQIIVCAFIVECMGEVCMNKKLKLNMKFENGRVICARSPDMCNDCISKRNCETINVFYDQYNKKDILECFNNSEKRR
ncbi:hypothetical protein HMPREF1084_01775 [Clostridium butyricum 60E.3]|nr:hypothetical protein HMPREF1084_01775 [Clostridium butyricum 60E.3]